MKYSITKSTKTLVVALDTESGKYPPRVTTFNDPNVILGNNDVCLLENGKPLVYLQKHEIGLIDGVESTSLVDAVSKIEAVINSLKLSVSPKFKGSVAPTDTPQGTDDAFWIATQAGTYTLFGNFVLPANTRAEISRVNGSFSVSMTALDLTDLKGSFPFSKSATFEGVTNNTKNAIIDLEIIGGNKNWRVAPHTIERNKSGQHYIRLGVYDENDALLTSVGNSGIIAHWLSVGYVEPTAVNTKIVDVINFTLLFGITSAKIVVDWSLLTVNTSLGINSYRKGGFDSRIFAKQWVTGLTSADTYSVVAKAEEKVWARTNLFALANLKEAIIDAKFYGVADKSRRFVIELIRYDNATASPRSFVGVREFSSTGVAMARVALWDVTGYVPPTLTNGKRIDTILLNQANASGISISLTIDWEKLPTSGTGWLTNYWYSNAFTVTDGEFSVNSYTYGGLIKQKGNVDTTFQLNGINARLVTSTGYDSDGTPDNLMIICHGNGQTYLNADPSATFKTFAKANKISYAIIQVQDETVFPFSGNATGWGNNVTIKRNIDLYNYLMKNYNFNRSVILSGQSMGGLTVGILSAINVLPIRFILGVGPVPSLKYIFNNGGVSRQRPIRAAYKMASDGSNDAQLDAFIQGSDWYYKNKVEISGVPYKFGMPNIYIIAGNGDGTFTTDFGGATMYNDLKNSINNAGGLCTYSEKSAVSHADPSIYDLFISPTQEFNGLLYTNGIFTKELGI